MHNYHVMYVALIFMIHVRFASLLTSCTLSFLISYSVNGNTSVIEITRLFFSLRVFSKFSGQYFSHFACER